MKNNKFEETQIKMALLAVGILYFSFGFITCLNDILVPHLRVAFDLNYAEAALVQFSFFMGYFIMSVPSGRLVDRLGFRKGMAGGLLLAALGCLLFQPAAGFRSYPVFLLALFILASGITLLQVAANPYVALLGPTEGASARLTLAGAFNSLGTTLAPTFGAWLILSAAAAPGPGRLAGVDAVRGPYLGLAVALFLLALATGCRRWPRGETRPDPAETRTGLLTQLRSQPALAFGALGIFMYVGAEVAISSFLVNYLNQPTVAAIPLAASARYVSIYWGGAMIGRFVGSAVMRVVPPARLLLGNAGVAAVLVLSAVLAGGRVSMWALLAVGFFNSIMFPTIFVLALKGGGARLGRASGLLCMAIVGGAVVPVLQGLLTDAMGLRLGFLLPAACYIYIAGYALYHRPVALPGGEHPLDPGPDPLDGLQDIGLGQVPVGDEAQGAAHRQHPDLDLLQDGHGGWGVGHRQQQDVGLRIGDGEAHALEPVGQGPGLGVVLGQPRQVFQRGQAGGGHDPPLAHSAAKHLADPPGFLDQLAAGAQHRTHGRAQALAETDVDGVDPPGQLRQGRAQGGRGMPEPGPVQMHLQPLGLGLLDQGPVLGHRQAGAAGEIVGVFQAQQGGAQGEVRAGAAGIAPDLHGRDPARAGLPGQRLGHAPRQPGRGAQLGTEHMGLGRRQEPVAALEVQHHGDAVGHAAGGGPQAGLLAQEFGHPVFQPDHGRIPVEHVVADLGLGHGLAHGGVGTGDGVGAEVEGAHAQD
jgi:FHS family L-fucose permease-like MFS transporter